jgi:hypothetical protein
VVWAIHRQQPKTSVDSSATAGGCCCLARERARSDKGGFVRHPCQWRRSKEHFAFSPWSVAALEQLAGLVREDEKDARLTAGTQTIDRPFLSLPVTWEDSLL